MYNRELQLTKEQYIKLIEDTVCSGCHHDIAIETSVKEAQKKGYIKMTELEEAKTHFEHVFKNDKDYSYTKDYMITTCLEYIRLLEKELNDN
jgi:hypothetical protein